MTRFLQLGASLYVPGTRNNLASIANRQKYPFLRSVIFCTEDAVRKDEVPRALARLRELFRRLDPVGLLRFVRVRNPVVLAALLEMDRVDRLDGFVFPKVTRLNLDHYFAALAPGHSFDVMLTLETEDVFNAQEMTALCQQLVASPWRDRILTLRIGGNDLLGLLGLRRPRGCSVYHTPLGAVIPYLVTTFRPHGFNLTAPVYEYLNHDEVLRREVRRDLVQGLFGKAAIHPRHVPIIEEQYRVRPRDLQMAEEILSQSAPAVF